MALRTLRALTVRKGTLDNDPVKGEVMLPRKYFRKAQMILRRDSLELALQAITALRPSSFLTLPAGRAARPDADALRGQ
ncbi:hypothetical protein ACCAA_550055 [Candidatus Accumulibacter aalborgensis]|uniref:Uncharacterized protein n=1 Tax=Candidatus Accumulibacter aalborgensis TaxID=1860102 RepID=A0A1A8XT30_9PROT|nr:hypothetical protein [Candidatus Accumulibacter aalborgensis]SBT08230.1 hypothetical protein ACCAA_550055 [Candidatus Accumulibacter aalborgensis]